MGKVWVGTVQIITDYLFGGLVGVLYYYFSRKRFFLP